MSFKYQGTDITNNFDDSIPGSQTTNFKIDGVDIGTIYTPAYTGFISNSTTNYKSGGSDIKSLFSSSKPVPTILLQKGQIQIVVFLQSIISVRRLNMKVIPEAPQ